MKNLFQTLAEAQTEEELKNFFAKKFKLKLATKNFIDLYTTQILFEFKLNKNLKNPQTLAEIVAQTLYYVRRLKFGSDCRPVNQNICIVTKNFAAIFPTESFADFFNDNSRYDWDLAPSSPCKVLVNDLSNSELIINAKIYDLSVYTVEIAFTADIERIFNGKSRNPKQITEQNFEQIFIYWQKLFGKDVKNGRKPSEYFITDIEQGKSEDLRNSVLFSINSGERVEKSIKPDKYREFWAFYDKISSVQDITAIRRKMDRMTEENLRRRTGEFYTPLQFADIRAIEDRFAALWIKKHRLELSAEALAVLDAARKIYKRFYIELERLDVAKWKISTWDTGWYQIRMALGATLSLEALSAKLEPQIYELGFLRDEVRYF